MDIVKFLQDNWAVIAAEPSVFVAMVVLFGGGGMLLGRYWRSDVVSSRDGIIALKDAEIRDYRRKLDGASPDEAAQKIAALEKRLAAIEPRELSSQQYRDLVAHLSKTRGSVQVCLDGGSSESRKLHGQIVRAFKEAGWNASAPMVFGIGSPPRTGIGIISYGGVGPSADARAIASGFSEVGLTADPIVSHPPQDRLPESVEIVVTSPTE